jgi:crotonobetainyl-CoA:carnitine CoA-transferase CaiB-like acyl-CoA transferase
VAQALDGIRILDLSWGIAGPLGVLLLAEQGADVVKVEPPGGDPFRAYAGYRCWDRSRRSVVLDLKAPDGPAHFLALAATADVVVETFRPGVLDRLGVGWDALHAVNPGLVLVSSPPYPVGHRRASRPGYEALLQASSGQMSDQPGWRMGPVMLHFPVADMGTAFLIPTVVLGALLARDRSGQGQHASTSLYQGVMLYTTQLWQEASRAPAGFHEMMARTYPPGIHQLMLFECANFEWLHYSVLSGLTPVKTLDGVLGLPEGSSDAARRERMRTWDRDALVDALRANGHAVDPVTPAADVLRHPQTIANGTAATVDGMTQMGVPIHLLGTPGAIVGPEPAVGADTSSVLAGLGAAPVAAPPVAAPPVAAPPPPAASQPGGPLAGTRLVDFGQFLAGPFGPMVLGDLGADVIKVEAPTGDLMRHALTPFIGCQRGKRSVAINLKDPAGLAVAHRLIPTADVVHHNMTRGVATRLGIDYTACRALRPDIVYCNTYAYGLPDPLGGSGGLDPLYQASSGLEYEAGAVHEGNPPLYIRFGMCDTANAMLSVVGILLALVHRARTGEGQELWTSLHDGGVFFSSDMWLDADGNGWARPQLDKGQHGLGPAYRLYRTQDEGWICVAAVTGAQWEALCAVTGAGPLDRDGEREKVEAALQAAFMARTALGWHRALDAAGVPNEIPVDSLDGQAFLHDGDNERLGLVAEYEHPLLGTLRQFGRLFDFPANPGPELTPPPLVGQHTREVLHELGLRDGDVDALISSRVAYEPDGSYHWGN